MHRQRYESVDDRVSSWRASLAVVQQVSQHCTTSLPALQACLDCFPGLTRLDVETCAKDLAFLGQQLCSLSHQGALCGSQANGSPQTTPQEHTQLSPQQQAELLVVLRECTRFCQAVTEALAANRPQQPQSLRPRWQQRNRQQQQQQQAPQLAQQQLPPAAATALCCCFRQWADPLSLSHPGSSSSSAAETGLQMDAVAALGALLPAQLPVIAAHERAASLALLLALAQPPLAPCSSSTTGSSTCAAASESSTGDRSQQNSQDWALACRAVAVLTDILQEGSSCSTSAATPAAQPGRSTATGQGRASSAAKAPAAASALHPDERSSITAALVEALSAACGIRSSSSRTGSTGGSSSGSGAHKFSSSGPGAGSSSGGSQEPAVWAAGAAGSKQQPLEGIQQSRYFAALLTALNAAVVSNRQGWQSHAGALTESARKLFMYGTQQQQQQRRHSASPSAVVASANGNSTPANNSISNGAAAGATAATAAGAGAAGASPPVQAPAKAKYVPPHARAATRAAGRPQPAAQQSQWQDSSDDSELSASDWSDMSDTEAFQGSSRRASSSSSSSESDPIKAARVRTALLQLLQTLIQMDPRALHPYWTALLPSQAPLQASPLSPHLVTMLLFDPVDKVRLLAAAVLGSLLEGPTARSLLAVAEAKSAQPLIRGFTTMSVSLGHMLLSLHTGLLAIVQAWQQQQRQQQQSQILPVPAVLLTAVLRVLCVLLPSTPYERMPSTLLPHVVQTTWELWQQLQPPNPAVDAAAATAAPATPREQKAAGVHRRAAVPSLDVAATQRGGGSSNSSSSSSSIMIAAVAVLAQAFSTKKPLPALGRWLQATDPAQEAAAATGANVARSGTSNSIGNSSRVRGQPASSQQGSTPSSGGSSSSGSSGSSGSLFGSRLMSYLLTAAGSPDCCLRIEALAAMRGACINYPQLLLHPELAAVASSSSSPSCAGVSSQCCWQQLLAVAQVSVAAAAQPASTRTTRSSPRLTHASAEDPPAAASTAGAADGSSSTSPEVKAGQHAVRLLGDWLAAVAAVGSAAQVSSAALQAAPDASDNSGAVPTGQQQRQQGYETHRLAEQWISTLQLLLSEAVWHHPSPVIRSAAAAVCGGIPADVWLVLPLKLHQQLLSAAAATAIGSDVTAVRAAACKLLGSCAVLPGALVGQPQQQQQQLPVEQQALQYQQQEQEQGQELRQDQQLVEPVQQQQHEVLQALSQCVGDQVVSVRLSAAWAMANVCDELKRQQDLLSSSSAHIPALPTSQALPQQQPQQHQHVGLSNAPGLSGLSLGPVAMQLLCSAAVAAAGDTEKVRAHGVRALGALLATWHLAWGLDCSSSSRDGAAAAAAPGAASASAEECAVPVGWAWAAAWLRQALGVLQACLAARSMKVVWNAACAVAAALQNQQLLKASASASSVPGLLLMLVVLVRDSSNYKIKTHAAAALAAPPDRAAYGEVFSDALLGVLSALQTLQGSSGSSNVQPVPTTSAVQAAAAITQKPEVAAAGGAAAALMGAAEGDGGDDEGTFPNYRYIPGLMQQLELSLLHMLPLLQPADATRLKEPLRRNQHLLLSLAAKVAASCAGQQQQAAAAAGAACSYMGCTTDVNCITALAQGQHAAGRDMHAAGPAEGSTQVDGQCAAQSALPADPFGQGPRLSSDGAVSEYACRSSSGAGRGPASSTIAAGRSTCAVHTGSCECGQDAGAAGASASASTTISGGLLNPPDAIKGLSQVLGPGVLDAWAERHGNIAGQQQGA